MERVPTEFVVIARYRAREGHQGRVEAALRNMVQPTLAEPGNLDYQVLRDPGDSGVFMLFERYSSQEAFAEHLASEHFATWLKGEVLPSLAERTRFDLVPLGSVLRVMKA